ncbi:MAG TPA: hypothetical protein DC049_14365, partial [Spirochaetia bacterium]|nr:hypothetical protein [Spirochaetia bacterium]
MAENNNNNRGFSFNTLLQNSDIILAAMVIVVVGMLIIPLPSFLMDFLLIVNILVSLLIIINVMYVSKAVDFSVFPSLLLFTTVFRLALNVSSTRLILTQGLAFDVKVIKAFASFVVSGNYVVGAIIFIILIAVQFMVITKGATRIAEVAARFRLDAMPNKFMAIDQDLNSGIITEKEALTKRAEVQNEANFYGAMDGASKFVQGDVQVGIVITLINVIGGLIIGVAIRREPIGTAVSSYIIFA